MIAGIVIGSIVLFLLLLLLIPVKVTATMEEELRLKLGYAFLRINILPAKEKPEDPEKEREKKRKKLLKKEAKKKKKQKEKEDKKKGIEPKPSFLKKLREQNGLSGLLRLAGGLVKIATTTLRHLFSHIVVYHLHLNLNIGTESAADTAVLHGKVCAFLDSCAAALMPIIPKKKRRDIKWRILPDFTSESTKIYLFAQAGIRPLFVFSAVFGALFRFIKAYAKMRVRSYTKHNYAKSH